MNDEKLRTLRVPFQFSGFVDIECTQEEYELDDLETLDEKASEAFKNQIVSMHDMEFDGFDIAGADWVDNNE